MGDIMDKTLAIGRIEVDTYEPAGHDKGSEIHLDYWFE
jgi:hypothetical protein